MTAAGNLGPLHVGKEEISSFYFLPAAFISLCRTTEKVFPLCPLITSLAISTLSLNMQIENTSRKHQEGTTAEAANWAVRHYPHLMFHKNDITLNMNACVLIA